MENYVMLPDEVIKRIKYLPDTDRVAITTALEEEYLYGTNPAQSLSPFQTLLYSMVRFYINRASFRSAI